jgi:hypothetical protein
MTRRNSAKDEEGGNLAGELLRDIIDRYPRRIESGAEIQNALKRVGQAGSVPNG